MKVCYKSLFDVETETQNNAVERLQATVEILQSWFE